MWKLNYILVGFLFSVVLAISVNAQSSSFTFQGKLTDSNAAANGNYEMQFTLFDGNNNQIGSTLTYTNIVVTNGIFTVQLPFGAAVFDGNPRFMQISVRPADSASPFTVLSPRQAILSSPYSIRSLNAATADNSNQLGGIAANQYVQTNDARLSDSRNPLANSPNYIQNSIAQQSNSNFNISGNGTLGGVLSANTVNAASQFNIGGNRILSNGGTNNLFVGVGSGANNTGSGNAFFGGLAGQTNATGINNAFFGFNAGSANNNGGANTFIGVNSGLANISSSNNTFIGANAGNSNATGNGNTLLGANSDGATFITNSVAIGQKAFVGQSNALILGSINGVNTATADTDVGIGTATPQARFHVVGNSAFIGNVGIGTTSPQTKFNISDTNQIPFLIESTSTTGTGFELFNPNNGLNTRWRITTLSTTLSFRDMSKSGDLLRLTPTGNGNGTALVSGDLNVSWYITVGGLPGGGTYGLCHNPASFISVCSSSRRYKKDIQPFTSGLSLINKLNPVTFRWKANDALDLGFVAEDVAEVEPLLTTTNTEGQIEGVKYDRISAVLVNAVKEQQTQIEEQQKKIETQQKQIDELKAVVCSIKPDAAVCREQ